MQETMEELLEFVEELFVKYGAEKAGRFDENKAELLGVRVPYVYKGEFYRVEATVLDEQDYIMISTIDDEKFANATVMDDIAAFPATYPKEKVEKEVRFALGIEPYPENYPNYN